MSAPGQHQSNAVVILARAGPSAHQRAPIGRGATPEVLSGAAAHEVIASADNWSISEQPFAPCDRAP